ncbi:hypothetical protein [Robertmurraya kyonggiensis]|uniref:Uncharacterized protein n=1 Tax=Robertmurraya kyonggiensis TaxID=1037680 RepID=A0A4U1D333_9BACI|nr:hypothetical protein [Robertmurraya kyonggiensis]TKC16143.1 hypothetical protein FA727_14390 [Robertmurraya kyonggiensis]
MGHDISGYNKAGEEIAYARFSMWNNNAILLYRLLDANQYYAGVSGSGKIATLSKGKIEVAMSAYWRIFNKSDSSAPKSDFVIWDQKQILDFIQNCLATAQKEGSVRVYFG